MRNYTHFSRYWFWYASVFLFALEELLIPLPRVSNLFHQVAVRDIPFQYVSVLTLSAFRSLVSIVFLSLCVELVVRIAARFLKSVRWVFLRFSLLGIAYSLVVLSTSGLLSTIQIGCYVILVCASLGIFFSIYFPSETTPWTIPSRRLEYLVVGGWLIFIFLSKSNPPVWETSPISFSETSASGSAPSFVLVGMDSVPSEFLNRAYWERGLDFQNAYAVTNSTYTSWFSILSGHSPHNTGVELLFLKDRHGRHPPNELITHQLLRRGYRTVFMTDCANTSFFESSDGFSELYQPDKNSLGCLKTAMESRHALQRGLFHPAHLDSECSMTFNPKKLFEVAEKKTIELSQSATPYFLAIHSCGSAAESVFNRHSGSEFLQKIDEMGANVKKLQATIDRYSDSTWSFYFGDHGVRWMGPGKQPIMHAVGEPLYRRQYNVPLIVTPPQKVPLMGQPEQMVTLLDLFPTISELAQMKLNEKAEGTSLAGVPSWNRGFILSSALPISKQGLFKSPVAELFRISKEGTTYLSSRVETTLLQERSLSYVVFPWRLLINSSGKVTAFGEFSDKPERISDQMKVSLMKEFCEKYPHPACPARLRQTHPSG